MNEVKNIFLSESFHPKTHTMLRKNPQTTKMMFTLRENSLILSTYFSFFNLPPISPIRTLLCKISIRAIRARQNAKSISHSLKVLIILSFLGSICVNGILVLKQILHQTPAIQPQSYIQYEHFRFTFRYGRNPIQRFWSSNHCRLPIRDICRKNRDDEVRKTLLCLQPRKLVFLFRFRRSLFSQE